MRTYASATGRLSETEIKAFLDDHIPYRLKLLHLGLAVAPASSLAADNPGLIPLFKRAVKSRGFGVDFHG
jgi:hypothetical protein